jgi:hypothetical protein
MFVAFYVVYSVFTFINSQLDFERSGFLVQRLAHRVEDRVLKELLACWSEVRVEL